MNVKYWSDANPDIPLEDRKKMGLYRLTNFLLLFLAYGVYYLVKYSFKKEYQGVQLADGTISQVEWGAMAMTFNMTYGISKFLNGNIADRVNARWFISIGLFLSSLFNLITGAFTNVLMITFMLVLVAWFQGHGITSVGKIFKVWLTKKERGVKLGLWNPSHNIGGGIAGFLAIGIGVSFWGAGDGAMSRMFLISLIGMITAVLLVFTIKESPKAYKLPSVEDYLNQPMEALDVKDQGVKSTFKNNLVTVLKNKYLIVFCVAFAAISVIRNGVGDNTWNYLDDRQGIPTNKDEMFSYGNFMFLMSEMGGIPAALFMGWFTDWRISKGGGRAMSITFGPIIAIIGLIIMWVTPIGGGTSSRVYVAIGMFLVSLGVWMLIALALTVTQDLSQTRTVATAVGLTGIFAYMAGSLIGNMLSGYLLDSSGGWNSYFILMVAAGVVSAIASFFLLFDKDLGGKKSWNWKSKKTNYTVKETEDSIQAK